MICEGHARLAMITLQGKASKVFKPYQGLRDSIHTMLTGRYKRHQVQCAWSVRQLNQATRQSAKILSRGKLLEVGGKYGKPLPIRKHWM